MDGSGRFLWMSKYPNCHMSSRAPAHPPPRCLNHQHTCARGVGLVNIRHPHVPPRAAVVARLSRRLLFWPQVSQPSPFRVSKFAAFIRSALSFLTTLNILPCPQHYHHIFFALSLILTPPPSALLLTRISSHPPPISSHIFYLRSPLRLHHGFFITHARP